jgi:hypothetical protein
MFHHQIVMISAPWRCWMNRWQCLLPSVFFVPTFLWLRSITLPTRRVDICKNSTTHGDWPYISNDGYFYNDRTHGNPQIWKSDSINSFVQACYISHQKWELGKRVCRAKEKVLPKLTRDSILKFNPGEFRIDERTTNWWPSWFIHDIDTTVSAPNNTHIEHHWNWQQSEVQPI